MEGRKREPKGVFQSCMAEGDAWLPWSREPKPFLAQADLLCEGMNE